MAVKRSMAALSHLLSAHPRVYKRGPANVAIHFQGSGECTLFSTFSMLKKSRTRVSGAEGSHVATPPVTYRHLPSGEDHRAT